MADNDAEMKAKKRNLDTKLACEQLKEAYTALAKNEVVMQDLREFCALSIPTDMSGKTPDLDTNKVLVATGRATVLERIDYFINTPLEQIVKRYLGA